MYIAIIAADTKKELMAQFCIAYSGILSRHNICATQITGKYIQDASGLEIEQMMEGHSGGAEQIAARVAFDEIDLVIFFRDTGLETPSASTNELLRLCDIHNIPVATNLATAEVLVMALDRGDLDWRSFVNPNSDYNRAKRERR